jgi:flagellar M-ring protein FliF
MDQWKKLLGSLSVRQRIMIAAIAIVVAAGLFSFTRWRRESSFTPLFTGMSSDDAGSVVQKLKEKGLEYKLKEGDGTTILVATDNLAELRLEMAVAGLPKTGRVGFELFDKTNLGTTDFAEHINYARAIEGELERSIRLLGEVNQARVHLTFPKDSVFLESKQPAKASVLLSLKPGARISSQSVLAICHLVSSAVEGLTPDAVSVVDAKGTLLSKPRRSGPASELPDEMAEYREKLERGILTKINSTLDPLLGEGKFRASVAIECDLTSGEESQEKYDPEQTVMLTSTKTEETSGTSSAAGVPGTASSLPRPVPKAAGSGGSMLRRSETIGYQPSKTVVRTRIPQGRIKRMSAALLIDHAVRWEDKNGKPVRTLVPPSAEVLQSIRELVTAAAGFNTERGDQLVVEALPFESTLHVESAPTAAVPAPVTAPTALGLPLDLKDKRLWIGAGVAGLVFIALAVFLFKKLFRRKRNQAKVTTQAAIEAGQSDKQVENTAGENFMKSLEDQADQKRKLLADAQEKLKSQPLQTKKSEVLVNYLRESVHKDPACAAGIIREWLHD